jgi:choline dehydrogenase
VVERVQQAVPLPRNPGSLMEHFMNSVQTVKTNHHDFERSSAAAADFIERVRLNQQKLTAALRPHYDFIVCGSGSSGSVVARRLAENPDASVLLLEAGGDDDIPEVMEAGQWPLNLGSERDWNFQAQPNLHLNGRSIPLAMGKVLGGGSSINVMTWARGHQSDWDFFASEAGDPAWSYESVLKIYRRIEDWHGVPDPQYRGTGGRFLSSPRRTPTRSLPPCSTALGWSGFPPLRIRMVG